MLLRPDGVILRKHFVHKMKYSPCLAMSELQGLGRVPSSGSTSQPGPKSVLGQAPWPQTHPFYGCSAPNTTKLHSAPQLLQQ